MIKKGGKWLEADWETALNFTATGIKSVIKSGSGKDIKPKDISARFAIIRMEVLSKPFFTKRAKAASAISFFLLFLSIFAIEYHFD